jgi:small GTP-binding protein
MRSPTPSAFKVVLIGDVNVGKTSLLLRFHRNTWSLDTYHTIGQTYVAHSVVVNNETILLHIWDTSGQEAYAAQSTLCLRDAHCCVIVCDASSGPQAYDLVKGFVERYRNSCVLRNPMAVLVGNKRDLLEPEQEEAEDERLSGLQGELSLKTFLVSAKTGEGVVEMFAFIAGEMKTTGVMGKATPETVTLESEEKGGGRKCC